MATQELLRRFELIVAEVEETPPPGRSPEGPGGSGFEGDDDSDNTDDDGYDGDDWKEDKEQDVFQFPPKEDPMM